MSIGINFVIKVGAHGECRARAYSRGLEAEPPVGFREEPLIRESAPPPEAESICVF